jgi:hypothetical protein
MINLDAEALLIKYALVCHRHIAVYRYGIDNAISREQTGAQVRKFGDLACQYRLR